MQGMEAFIVVLGVNSGRLFLCFFFLNQEWMEGGGGNIVRAREWRGTLWDCRHGRHPLMSSRPQWLSIGDLLRIVLFCNLAQMGKGFLRPRPSQRSSWQFKLAVPRAEGVTFFSWSNICPGANESVANELFFLMQEAKNRHLNVKHGGPWDPWRCSGLPSKTLLGPRPHDTSHSKVRYTA